MGIYANDVQKLYIAYFNRPADPVGLAYWEEQIAKNGGSAAVVANAFSASAEYKALYDGKSSAQIVDAIYQNLFGRSAEPSGLTYWAVRLENGTFNVGNIAVSIMVGAQNDDKKVIDNKVVVATEFTAALDTTAEILAYSGSTAAATARTFLSTVGATDASLTAAKAAVATTVTSLTSTTVANGTTYTLTTGVDNIAGTANNDTILGNLNGGSDTFSAGDVINGGAGTDTLKVTDVDGGVNTGLATISGVEVVEIVDAVTTAADFAHDLTGVTGVTSVTISKDNNAGQTTTVQGLKSTVAVTLDAQADGTIALTYSDAGDTGDQAATITYKGGSGAAGTNMTAAGIETVNLVSSGSASDVGTLTFADAKAVTIAADEAFKIADLTLANAATKTLTISGDSLVTATAVTNDGALTTITVTGSAGYKQSDALGAAVTKVDASGTSGSLTVTSAANTQAIVGGSGADEINVAAVVYSGTAQVDAGAGTDKIILGADEALASTTAANLLNFEAARVTGDADGETYDFANFTKSTIAAVELTGGAATHDVTVSNLSAAAAAAITVIADLDDITIGVKDATTPGTADSVTLTLDHATADTDVDLTGPIAIAGVETLNIVSKGNATSTATDGTEVNTIADLTGSSVLRTVNISGDTKFGLTVGGNIPLETIVSTATAAVTVDASAITGNGVAYTGAASVDTFTGTANVDVIKTGAGNDVVTGGVGADIIDIGTGRDIVNISADDDTGGGTDVNSSSTTAFDKVTGFTLSAAISTAADLSTNAKFQATTATAGGSDVDLLNIDVDADASVPTDQALAVEANGTGAAQAASATYTVTNGILTLSGTGAAAVDTLAEWLAEAAAVAATAGDILAFQFGSDTYVYAQNGSADVLVQLVGVTGATSLVEVGAATTASAGAILYADIA